MHIRIVGLSDLPEIQRGDDLSAYIPAGAARIGEVLDHKTIVVVAQKVISKAEGAVVDLREIHPSPFAEQWGKSWGKDPRLIELVLQQSRRVVKMDRGVLVTETHRGLVMANAGVDQSNVPGEHMATILPDDPDASAHRLRQALGCGAVIITDTFGRPWREGLVNVAIGVSGIDALEDLRGSKDREGHVLQATIVARADELASAAGLVMAKSAGVPVALIQDFEWTPSEGSAAPLVRDPKLDLFR